MDQDKYDYYMRKNGLTEDDRVISKKDQAIYEMCHHEFQGLSQQEAASWLGISSSAVHDTLQRVKAVAPQLFPIITKRQFEVVQLITCDGLMHEEVAERLGVTVSAISNTVEVLKKRGFKFPTRTKPPVKFNEYQDKFIREKF